MALAHDPVNPDHYKSRSVECIDLVEMLPFCEGNAIKYLWRAGMKGPPVEDLKKALWYVTRAKESRNALSPYNNPRPFNWVLQRALDDFSDEAIRNTIRCIGLGKLGVARQYLEEMIARASPVPPHSSELEECNTRSA